MQASPLQLETLQFTRIELAADSGEVDLPDDSLSCEVGYAVANDDARRYRVSMKLGLGDKPGNTPAYIGKIELFGNFKVVDSWSEKKIMELVSANGPAVLYGAAREMILNLTARFPHGSKQIPTVRFAPIETQDPRTNPQKATPAKRKKNPKNG